MIDDAIEQIVVGFSDKAILRLDIEEDDPRLSRVCDDMRQTVRAILSRLRGEAVLEDCDIAWLWKVHADAQSKGLHADQRKIERILAALTTPAPASERKAVLDLDAAAERFQYEHRISCYPYATEFEARDAAEQIVRAALRKRDGEQNGNS